MVAAASVVGSFVSIKARRNMVQIFSSTMRKLWKEWELRALVLLSLVLQIMLIIFGNRRKYSSKIWVRVLLWCAYLMADWVATVALGVLLNNMGDVYEEKGKGVALDAGTQLTAFWAPFLLLHLGGPDTITAYSLEDNELWLRHFLGLGVQTGVALYIFLLAWTGSRFSVLTMPMFLAGMIKYGERTWALRSASNEELRDSMLTAPDPGPNYSKFMEEFTLKQFEGFHVAAAEVIERQVEVDMSSLAHSKGESELLEAHYLFKTFKRLFVDLILSFQDRDNSKSLFKDISIESAFKVIEIELGFMFDMLYTKGTTIYSRKGCCLRFITLGCTCIVLFFFSLSNKRGCSKIDIAITFLLLVIAILLELYAVLLLISSDWTDLYLLEKKGIIRQAITYLQLCKCRRWSDSISQYSLLSYSLRSKPVINGKIQKLLGMDKMVEYLHTTSKGAEKKLKEFIFNHLKKKFEHLNSKSITGESSYQKELKDMCMCRGARALGDREELYWSVDVEFDQSIIIWHIATILCNHADSQVQNENKIEVPSEQIEQKVEGTNRQNKGKNEVQSGQSQQKSEVPGAQGGQSEQKINVPDEQSKQESEVRSGQDEQKNEIPNESNEQIYESPSGEIEAKPEVSSNQNEQKNEVSSEQSERENEESRRQNEQKNEMANEESKREAVPSGQSKQTYELTGVQNEYKNEMPIDQNEKKSEMPSDQSKLVSNSLSQYMLYLMVMRPSMLPMGIGKIRYQDTCAEATKFFQEHESISGDIRKSQNLCSWLMNLFKEGKSEPYEAKASNALLNVNTTVLPVKVKGDRSKSVLFDACRLASQLQDISDISKKWEMISNVWVEMLAYAASHCRGTYHAQQLGRGGELLTHVWLLMAHFGLTEQFQISHGHARAKLVVK